jgi:hypothetical protein
VRRGRYWDNLRRPLFFSQYLEQVPIPAVVSPDRQAIERLVRRLVDLDSQGEEVPDLQAELNERVYRLFGLSKAEVALIEESVGSAS